MIDPQNREICPTLDEIGAYIRNPHHISPEILFPDHGRHRVKRKRSRLRSSLRLLQPAQGYLSGNTGRGRERAEMADDRPGRPGLSMMMRFA